MDSAANLQQLRSRLGSIDRENTERLALIEKRATRAAQESKDSTQRLATNANEVLTQLNERAQRIRSAGGWATESSTANSAIAENDFGFDEEEHAPAQPENAPVTRPLPLAPPPAPVQPLPEAPITKPAGGRPVRRAPVEEDDYAHTDWTAD
ncbi:hypothetical protein [Amycolatopsis palatopharyngis]|uniref:hypothetical protein n=1 Tax=Amycolatopsis palatopharyngis TaxID=187982 RepID=UPI000E2258E7|nr:hypothetical protein [Amycolatopsis palatopharyngis]